MLFLCGPRQVEANAYPLDYFYILQTSCNLVTFSLVECVYFQSFLKQPVFKVAEPS